jgi:hypothetical protein
MDTDSIHITRQRGETAGKDRKQMLLNRERYYRRNKTPGQVWNKECLWAQFAPQGQIAHSGYGTYIWELDPSSEDVTEWSEIKASVTEAIYKSISSGGNPLDIDLLVVNDDWSIGVAEDSDLWRIAEQAANCFAPDDIIESAAGWDDPDWVEWFCDHFDIAALAWGAGAVVLDDTCAGLKYLGEFDYDL